MGTLTRKTREGGEREGNNKAGNEQCACVRACLHVLVGLNKERGKWKVEVSFYGR